MLARFTAVSTAVICCQNLTRVCAQLTCWSWRDLSFCCLLAAGDGSLIKKPKAFPYIPGGDICGTVEAIGPDVTDFQPGDAVVATWSVFGEGGLAEYAIVNSKLTVKKPDAITQIEGAALANSAGHAVQACTADLARKELSGARAPSCVSAPCGIV
jgi:threonine dehydrogenase-like Zn-dependent dehydrogenase